ncbi:MAG: DUF481 domain-containing protein [Sphingobium sp.]
MARSLAIWSLPACLLPSPLHAEIVPVVEAMIREAAKSGNQSTLDAVVKVAKATNPQSADEIGALANQLTTQANDRAKKEREQRLASQGYLQGWTGEGQAGFGLTSGNTEEISGAFGLSLKKEGLQTRQKLEGIIDFLRTNGVTTREKFAASYGLDYLLREGFYTYGIVGWEQDRFAGYTRRFTESLGVGLRVLNRPRMTLDLDAGPAFRQTLYTDGGSEFEVGPRASLAYKWTLRDGMTLSEDASVVSSDGTTTFISNTAFTSRLTKALSGRLSFNIQGESNRPEGSKPTDTTTRATLVYKF